MRERRGRVIEARPLANRVTLVSIACVDPPIATAQAGQFVSLRVPGVGRRSYSLVSRAGEIDRFDIVLKAAVPAGGTAELVRALAPGTEVSFFGPMGYFMYETLECSAVLFGATGVGISALLPMINEALAGQAPSVELFWGLREPADLFFEDRLDALAEGGRFTYTIYYSSNGDGYMTEPLVARAIEAPRPQIYLCGHGQMIADVSARLRGKIEKARIHTEVFYPVISAD